MEWNNVSDKLPEKLKSVFDGDGNIDNKKPYLGIFYTIDELVLFLFLFQMSLAEQAKLNV